MSWVKLDDHFPIHRKTLEAGPLALAMNVAAICYCARELTDGLVKRSILPSLIDLTWLPRRMVVSHQTLADRLIAAGAWQRADDDTYEVHDYLAYNPSRAQVMEDRELGRRRSAMNADPELARIIQARDKGRCRYCATVVNWRDRKGPRGGTYDHVQPAHQGGDESYANLVTACKRCNLIKGARTPDQAGMVLIPLECVPDIAPESRRNHDTPVTPYPVPEVLTEPISPDGESTPAHQGRRRPETSIPDDFDALIQEDDIAWVQDKCGLTAPQILLETEKFKTKAKARDWRYRDWPQAWRNWMATETGWKRDRLSGQNRRGAA